MRLKTIIAIALCLVTCLSAHALDGDLSAYVSDIMSEESIRILDAYMRNTSMYSDYEPWHLFDVMQAELGRWQAWDYKVHAYYTLLMKEYGLQQDDWIESVLPGEDALQEPEALFRAKKLLESMYGYTESSHEDFIVGTSYVTKQNHDHAHEWIITFQNNTAGQYQFVLSQDGALMGFNGADGSFFPSDMNLYNGMDIVSAVDWPINADKATVISKDALFEKHHDSYEDQDPSAMGIMAYPLHTSLYSVSPTDIWLVHFYQEGEVVYKVLLEPDGRVLQITHVTDEVDLVSPPNG